MCLRKLLVALILSAAASASVPLDALPSEGALQALAASGINSAAEAAALGLDSADLRELGVAEVNDRVAILRQRNEVVAAAASVAAAAATSVGGVVTPEQTRQDFNFVASHVNTTRQWGKCINIVVKYRYPRGSEVFFDYRDMRELALHYACPTEELPIGAEWEQINMRFVQESVARWNVTGLSSQFQVMESRVPEVWEPGNHGSTITTGDIEPVQEPWVNNFRYDCTSRTSPM